MGTDIDVNGSPGDLNTFRQEQLGIFFHARHNGWLHDKILSVSVGNAFFEFAVLGQRVNNRFTQALGTLTVDLSRVENMFL